MEIKNNITIELTEEDVKEIIAKHLKFEGYNVKSSDVKLSVGSRIEGYGMSEHEVNYFRGCYVHCND